MKYCKRHDLAFCPEHEDLCLLPTCELVEHDRALFCSVCIGIVDYHYLKKTEKPNATDNQQAETASDDWPSWPDPDQQV